MGPAAGIHRGILSESGISVTEGDPAYTSKIGRNKFSRPFILLRRRSGNRAAVSTILGEAKPAWRPWQLTCTCTGSR
jgi:hypothetical protein